MRNRNIAEYQKPCKVYINFIFTLRCKYLKMKRNEINHSLFIVLLIDG